MGRVQTGGRRERRKAETRARIVAAAAALFAAKGYDATTTREIAARADIGAGTLFLYVRDKRELLLLVFEDALTAAVSAGWRRAAAVEGGFVARVHAVFATLFELYARDEALSRRFVREQVMPLEGVRNERIEEQRMKLFAGIARELGAAQERGEAAGGLPVDLVVSQVFSLYFTALTGWLGGLLDRRGAEAVLRGWLELLFRGLAAR